MKKSSPEHEIIVSHMVATTAAFQCLVLLLQRNGILERGEYQDALDAYIKSQKDKHPDMVLALLDDLRLSLLS